MYQIDRKNNCIKKIEETSFSELGFREREHLQEWLADNPDALGEPILIIQKEFDGFNDTNERLDLLGIDKQGNLVIIENKLDDTGRDTVWQVIKYASYCSTLKKDQIRKIYQEYLNKQPGESATAEENLMEFFDTTDFEEISLNSGQTQRIMMIAGSFRKEVTSTVLWLMNYKLRIQCFKLTPYQLDQQLFLNVEQIIPVKDAEDYVISMADKAQEDIHTQGERKARHLLRLEFWKQLLKAMGSKTDMFQNISPGESNWLGTGAGLSGVLFYCVISRSDARVELYLAKKQKEENKHIFHALEKQKAALESAFGETLVWEELPTKQASRIKYELSGVDYFEKDDWERMIEFLVDGMLRLEKTFRAPLQKIKSPTRRPWDESQG